jgi:hypothetical protein
MIKASGWVTIQKAEELLGLDRKTLFKYRDNGTLKLGPHYAAFPETRSRDTYRWNVSAVRKQLKKHEKTASLV